MTNWDEEPPLALVPLEGRGSLPFALVHGESLVAAASWAAGEAGFHLLEHGIGLDQVRASGRTLVIHDPLCPLAPVDHLVAAAELAERTGRAVVSVRPVTDTVKEVVDGHVGATVDRDDLVCVASPVVLPAVVLARLDKVPVGDLSVLFELLREGAELLEAPLLARRITGAEDLLLLEALSRVSG